MSHEDGKDLIIEVEQITDTYEDLRRAFGSCRCKTTYAVPDEAYKIQSFADMQQYIGYVFMDCGGQLYALPADRYYELYGKKYDI